MGLEPVSGERLGGVGETERMTYLSAVNAAKNTLTDTGKLKAELLDVLSGEGGSILEKSRDELLALLD